MKICIFKLDGGWAAGLGYPAMKWDPEGEEIPVAVLRSLALPAHWDRLDQFEGPDYCRILVPVYREKEIHFIANVYALAKASNPGR